MPLSFCGNLLSGTHAPTDPVPPSPTVAPATAPIAAAASPVLRRPTPAASATTSAPEPLPITRIPPVSVPIPVSMPLQKPIANPTYYSAVPSSTDLTYYLTAAFFFLFDNRLFSYSRLLLSPKHSAPLTSEGLRRIVVYMDMFEEFMERAEPNTRIAKETCGVLAGVEVLSISLHYLLAFMYLCK